MFRFVHIDDGEEILLSDLGPRESERQYRSEVDGDGELGSSESDGQGMGEDALEKFIEDCKARGDVGPAQVEKHELMKKELVAEFKGRALATPPSTV